MQLEYFSDQGRQTAPVLLVYGDEPDDAVVLRSAADELAAGEIGHQVRVDRLPGFRAIDDSSLVALLAPTTAASSDQRAPPGLSMRTPSGT